jgi:DNA (cytosine-5)-methyltransferase 1
MKGLRRLGFDVTERELYALDFGVPQTRRRIVLSAMRAGQYEAIRPRRRKGPFSVRDAIGRLPRPIFYSPNLNKKDIPYHPNHWTMNPISSRFRTKAAVAHGGRCFKRLSWWKPCPTIAFGHREIYIHPTGKRRLSIFEAMLLQGFPRSFVLEGNLSEQVEQVSNAVPPPLAKSLAAAIRRTLAG